MSKRKILACLITTAVSFACTVALVYWLNPPWYGCIAIGLLCQAAFEAAVK